MSLSKTSTALLQLEESLLILEESLQRPAFQNATNKKHIQRLKQFYSPLFDFEHSESGSYYYATLRCIKSTYLDDDAIYHLPLSPLFIQTIYCLLEINTLSLDTKRNKNGIAEALIKLANLWDLHNTNDIADLIMDVVSKLREDVVTLLNSELNKPHEQ